VEGVMNSHDSDSETRYSFRILSCLFFNVVLLSLLVTLTDVSLFNVERCNHQCSFCYVCWV